MKRPAHPFHPAPYWGFACFLYRRFRDTRLSQAAGSLTFTTLLALVPLLTVMLSILAQLPAFDSLSAALTNFIRTFLVPRGAEAVGDYFQQFLQQAGRLTVLGTAMMVFASLLLIQTIDETFNRIWHIRTPRAWWIRLGAYILLLLIGPMLAAFSLSASAYLLSPEFLEAHLPALSGSLKILTGPQTTVRLLFDCTVLWLLYRLVPNCHVPPRHACLGALLTALCLEAAKWGFARYLAHFNSYELIYGPFAVIPVFLVWLHLLWLIVLCGALLTACLSYWHNAAYRHEGSPQAGFGDAVAVLLLLHRAEQQGQSALRDHDFRPHIAVGYDALANLLNIFSEQNYIRNLGRRGWQLQRPAAEIKLADVFALCVYRPEPFPAHRSEADLNRLLRPALANLDISLAEWAQRLETESVHPDGLPSA